MEKRIKELETEVEDLKKLIDLKDKDIEKEKERNSKLTKQITDVRKELEVIEKGTKKTEKVKIDFKDFFK